MEELEPITGPLSPDFQQPASLETTATNAFGLEFESLLQIILTQLQFQDPLQPLENFEFVSQLAQFSQIQQAQTMNERLLGLLQSQSISQATDLLGREVIIPTGAVNVIGRVTTVSFQNGEPFLSILTDDDQLLRNVSLSAVSAIQEGST